MFITNSTSKEAMPQNQYTVHAELNPSCPDTMSAELEQMSEAKIVHSCLHKHPDLSLLLNQHKKLQY